jgi:indole-3-glycerol phosphate synthase
VRDAVGLPVLKRGLSVDRFSPEAGGRASAVLLIVRAPARSVTELFAPPASCVWSAAEVRDAEELQRAVDAASANSAVTCIGVTNRNLETRVIDAIALRN